MRENDAWFGHDSLRWLRELWSRCVSLKNLASCLMASSSRQPRDGGNDNRAKVKNDGSGISPNTFEPLSLSKAVLKAAAREVSNGSRTARFFRKHTQGPQGPLSDQVADAPNSRRQCRSWVDCGPSCIAWKSAAVGQLWTL